MPKTYSGLTEMQRKFCEEYLEDLNGTRAAVRAGYASKGANNQAAQLMRNPKIKAHIEELIEERRRNSKVTEDYVLRKIVRTLERCEKTDDFNPTAVLRATELLARHLGMFTEKQEISGPGGGAIQMEKVQNDATDFTRSIARLAKRGGARGGVEEVKPGDTSKP